MRVTGLPASDFKIPSRAGTQHFYSKSRSPGPLGNLLLSGSPTRFVSRGTRPTGPRVPPRCLKVLGARKELPLKEKFVVPALWRKPQVFACPQIPLRNRTKVDRVEAIPKECTYPGYGILMRVVIYARVSTDRQNHGSQLTELKNYCARRGWKDSEVITDVVSGKKSSREGLDRLMRAVRRGKVDVVVCFKLDRLGRSLSHLAGLIDEFTTHNVALVVPGQGIDTSSANPAAKLQLNILCAVAEFERSIIVERVNAGLAAAKARGVRLGRPPRLEVHRAEVARLRAEGLTGRAIAKKMGIPPSSAFKLIAEWAKRPSKGQRVGSWLRGSGLKRNL